MHDLINILTLATASSSSSAAATSSLSSPEKVSSRSKTSTRNDQSHQATRGGGFKKNALMESMKNLSEMEIEDDEEKGASAAAGKFMHRLHLFKFCCMTYKETIKLSPGDSRVVVFILDEESGYSLCELH